MSVFRLALQNTTRLTTQNWKRKHYLGYFIINAFFRNTRLIQFPNCMTLQNNDKKDALITGWRARWYSISSTILGLSLVRRKALLALSLKNGENLLDIGCGSGDFLERIHERYGDDVILFGVDGSPDMIEEARRRTKGMDIAFMVAQAQELPSPSETFDSVVSTLVFHHISPKGKRTAIKEICRVLKVGGRCVITDLVAEGICFW